METYPKINSIFKRYITGPQRGKLIINSWACPEFEYLAKNRWVFTEKVDGTNVRIGWHSSTRIVEFGGRSDNAVIPVHLLEHLQTTFTSDEFVKIGQPSSIILFGEGYGPKIQGGGKYRDDHSFVLFDVKCNGFWLSRENVNDIASKLGIESVPVIGEGTLYNAIDIVRDGYTFNNQGGIIRYGRNGLQSRWGEFAAEGIVARPSVNLFNNHGDRIIVKVKAKDFK